MEFTKTKLTMRTLASGNELNIPVFTFKGSPGKKVYIQANIHGPEIAGIAALYRLIPLLQQEKAVHGEVVVVPSINPVGFDQKFNALQVGYADPNEYVVGNYNRAYQMLVKNKPLDGGAPDPEAPRKVVLEDFVLAHLNDDGPTIQKAFKAALKEALDDIIAKNSHPVLRYGLEVALGAQAMDVDADYVIDLHTDAISTYYGYSFPENVKSYAYFDVPVMIKIDADDWDGVFDEAFLIPWVKLQRAFKKAGRDLSWAELDKEAITLELGSADTVDYKLAQEDAERIMNYLRFKGVLDGKPSEPKSQVIACEFKHRDKYYAPLGGLVFWDKKPGDQVQAGDCIATILRPGETDAHGRAAEIKIIARNPGLLLTVCRSQSAHQAASKGIDAIQPIHHHHPVPKTG